MKRFFLFSAWLTLVPLFLQAQDTLTAPVPDVAPAVITSHRDVAETNPIIVERLEEWQDLKLGLFFHWGLYSQWGEDDAWIMCSEPWYDRGESSYIDDLINYRKLNSSFKAKKFDATKWAKQAVESGARYSLFSAKGLDGFCMWNTSTTSFSVVDKSCPYSKHAKSDIMKELVEAFRSRALWTGFYFSKADWSSPYYWAPQWATPDRNVNYNPSERPQLWTRYCEQVRTQVNELTHNYGGIDMLWLDAEWVRPLSSMNDFDRDLLGCRGWVQDIDVPTLASTAREKIPDLLIADKGVHGRFENYEIFYNEVPTAALNRPWEALISIGEGWSWKETDTYLTATELVHTLCDVVSKGGNLLLCLGPDGNGALPDSTVVRLKALGKWLKTNGEAIYSTRPIAPYGVGSWRFTQSKDGKKNYAIYLIAEGETVPEVLVAPVLPPRRAKAKLIGGGKVTLREENGQYSLYLKPKSAPKHAVVIAFE